LATISKRRMGPSMRLITYFQIATMVVFWGQSMARAELHQDPVVFRADFQGEYPLRAWGVGENRDIRLVPGLKGEKSLLIERSVTEGPGSRTVQTALPVDKLRGTRV